MFHKSRLLRVREVKGEIRKERLRVRGGLRRMSRRRISRRIKRPRIILRLGFSSNQRRKVGNMSTIMKVWIRR